MLQPRAPAGALEGTVMALPEHDLRVLELPGVVVVSMGCELGRMQRQQSVQRRSGAGAAPAGRPAWRRQFNSRK